MTHPPKINLPEVRLWAVRYEVLARPGEEGGLVPTVSDLVDWIEDAYREFLDGRAREARRPLRPK